MPQNDPTYGLIKNFDGKYSFYFYSNSLSFENSTLNLEKNFSDFLNLEQKIKEYEELLKRYKEERGVLEKEIDK